MFRIYDYYLVLKKFPNFWLEALYVSLWQGTMIKSYVKLLMFLVFALTAAHGSKEGYIH